MMKATLVALASLFAGCANSPATQTLRIATDATFPPFHFVDDAGAVTGFDVDLASAAAVAAGFNVELVVVAYDELFAGLKNGDHDVVAASTGITPERKAEYLFSIPYYETCQAAVVRSGASEPRSLFDLRDRRLGAAGSGTSLQAMHETLAAEYFSIGDGEGVEFLAARKIDAWIVDEFDAVAVARGSHGELVVLPEPVSLERYGLVLARGRADLKKRLDESLAALIDDGSVAGLRRKFGVQRDAEWPVRW